MEQSVYNGIGVEIYTHFYVEEMYVPVPPVCHIGNYQWCGF